MEKKATKKSKKEQRSEKNSLFFFFVQAINSIIRLLLHPASLLAPIVMGLIVTTITLVEPSNSTPPWIKYLITNKPYAIGIIVVWLIIALIFIYYDNQKTRLETRIEELSSMLEQQQNQVDQTTRLLSSKYGDFSMFARQLLFKSVLNEFVNGNPEIDSCQLYAYSLHRIGDDINIKICNQGGYCCENVEINSIMQSYYELNYSDYSKFQSIMNKWKLLRGLDDEFFTDAAEKVLTQLIELSDILISKLNKLNGVNDIKNIHFAEYRLLNIIIFLTKKLAVLQQNKANDNGQISSLSFEGYVAHMKNPFGEEKKEVADYLEYNKRTGLMGSILTDEEFGFSYEGQSEKCGRVYVCFPIDLFGVDTVVLFTIPRRALHDDVVINREISGYIDDFRKRFESKI